MSGRRARRPPPRHRTAPRGTPRERLLFNVGTGTVPGRNAVQPSETRPTFATAIFAEPRDWGYGGLLAFTAVLLLRPQDHVPALNPLHVAEICALLGIAPMLLHRLAHRVPLFHVTRETLALFAFGFVMVATVPFSVWPGGAFQVFTDAYVKIVIVFVLMLNTVTTTKRLEQLTWLIVVCCGYVAFRAVLDYAQGNNLVEQGRVSAAIGGLFGGPNDLALNLVVFVPPAAVVAINPGQATGRRIVAAFIVVLMVSAIVFTKSRGGALGLLAVIITLALIGRKVRKGFGTIVLAGSVIAAVVMPASFWARMESIVNEDVDREQYTGSREARRIVMEEGIHVFLEFPLTGVGAGQFQNYNPAGRRERWRETHNVLIQVAAETGAFGLLALVYLIVRAAMAAASIRRMLAPPAHRDDPDPLRAVMGDADRRSLYAHAVAMTTALIGWVVCAQFASVAYNWTFYYLLALIIAPRELVSHRVAAARAMEEASLAARSLPSAVVSPRLATPLAFGTR